MDMRARQRAGEREVSTAVLASRAAHGVISAVFLACIASVWLAAWRGEAGPLTYAAVAALAGEGVLVLLSRGNCPLGPLFRRLGDEKPFFELLLPPRAAKLAVPALGAVASVGVVVLGVRAF
jgi:hypothetical protein